MNSWDEIQKTLCYSFKDKELLIRAFTHSSYSPNGTVDDNYERLEFLGDAFLDYIVGLHLYKTYPNKKEGELTKIRANLVRAETLGEILEKNNLTQYIRTAKGEQTHPILNSIAVKCDVFEAVIGAILIDSDNDIRLVENIVLQFLQPYLTEDFCDYKSLSLEYCAKNKKKGQFIVLEEKSEDYNKIFTVGLFVDDVLVAKASGNSKKSAETQSARLFLKNIQKK